MIYAASLPRDANRSVVPGGTPFTASKAKTYTGAAGLGATGAATLFTATGDILVKLFAVCGVSLAGATATIQAGNSGNTGAFMASLTATGIVAGNSWASAGNGALITDPTALILAGGGNIIETIGTAAISAGQLTYYAFWRPLSANGNLVAA